MNNGVTSRLRVDIQVSEPWEFVTACRGQPIFGTIERVEGQEAWIALDATVEFNGSQLGFVIATARYAGQQISESSRGISVNAAFYPNPQPSREGIATIGVLTVI
jgi:hypothetical protein